MLLQQQDQAVCWLTVIMNRSYLSLPIPSISCKGFQLPGRGKSVLLKAKRGVYALHNWIIEVNLHTIAVSSTQA